MGKEISGKLFEGDNTGGDFDIETGENNVRVLNHTPLPQEFDEYAAKGGQLALGNIISNFQRARETYHKHEIDVALSALGDSDEDLT